MAAMQAENQQNDVNNCSEKVQQQPEQHQQHLTSSVNANSTTTVRPPSTTALLQNGTDKSSSASVVRGGNNNSTSTSTSNSGGSVSVTTGPGSGTGSNNNNNNNTSSNSNNSSSNNSCGSGNNNNRSPAPDTVTSGGTTNATTTTAAASSRHNATAITGNKNGSSSAPAAAGTDSMSTGGQYSSRQPAPPPPTHHLHHHHQEMGGPVPNAAASSIPPPQQPQHQSGNSDQGGGNDTDQQQSLPPQHHHHHPQQQGDGGAYPTGPPPQHQTGDYHHQPQSHHYHRHGELPPPPPHHHNSGPPPQHHHPEPPPHGFGPRQQTLSQSGYAKGPSPFGPPPPQQHHQGPPPPQPQRFVSGQALSQGTGPTPTLNQLLQSSSNPMQRAGGYPSGPNTSYGTDQHQQYNQQPPPQSWPPPKQQLAGPFSSASSPGPAGSSSQTTQYHRNQSALNSPYGATSPAGGHQPVGGYGGDGRGGWPGGPVPGQHGPGSPGPPNSSSGQQPSPQSQHSQSHSPGPSVMPPSPQQQQSGHPGQHQGFPNRPAEPTTPNAHGPDVADLSGGNSNDSSGGPAPGTPNSQGMRPTPSPTGSTGSRSMSPAVGQQNIPMPPRPSSGQSDSGGGPTRLSHSPMGTQGSYQSPHASPHPGHVHGYKGHPGVGPSGPQNSQQLSSLYQQNQQYSQGVYPPRPQGNIQYPGQSYSPGASQPPGPPTNSLPSQQQPYGQSRPVPNHMMNSQFQPYQQQQWPPVSQAQSPGGSGKGGPPQAPSSPSPGQTGGPQGPQQRPPHYLKQHLQHKMGFGAGSAGNQGSVSSSPSPPQQNYHMGPPTSGHHTGMGPPPSMGPPNMPPTSGGQLLANNHTPHDGPMPPPSSTPNSHSQLGPDLLDNGITTTAQANMGTHVTATSVTSVVTTGPDGTPVDEGSQQSTLSNASAASGEDPQCTTPKSSRKNDMGGHYSHPTTPQSTVPSPGAASINSMHEDYGEMSSPGWPRPPASPVFNSHVPPPETYRSKKTDSLGKLYEMDDSPDRRVWLDKLLAFMEERRTPITTCPTISKNPLDLFRLYVFVKERGGFMEVTKNKTWKDIAGMLGIGASSSAAYTLRKHYTKNLLAYECQFDRGGIDPQPIINQVEASSKKKGAKAASVPSPGSSNSQDSFPPGPGVQGNTSMDGYGYGYPPAGNPDYNAQSQRPASQGSIPSPHGGTGGAGHLNNVGPGSGVAGGGPAGGAPDNVSVSNPFDDISPSPPPPRAAPFPGSGGAAAYPPSGPVQPPRSQPPPGAGQPPPSQPPQGPYPPTGGSQQPPPGAGYPSQYPPPPPPSAGPPDQYSGYASAGAGYPPSGVRPVYPPYSGAEQPGPGPGPGQPPTSQGPTTPASQDPYNRYASGSSYSPRPASYTSAPGPVVTPGPPVSQQPPAPYPAQEYYHQDQSYPPQQNAAPASSTYGAGAPPNKNMPPPGPQPPRRHPDFAKDQQPPYPPYSPRPPPQMYGNWPNNNQYRPPQYTATGSSQVPNQSWNQGGRPAAGAQWDHRYPPGGSQSYQAPQQGQPQWSSISTPGVGQSSPLRAPSMGPRQGGKPFPGMPGQQPGPKGAGQPQPTVATSYPGQGQMPKREITFPPDSIEATLPVLYRRKKLCRSDLNQVDAWRIIMCLRSGLLFESTYALDVLNILLYDDSSVAYFGLNQWPGLLDLLLEHFKKSLTDMFDDFSTDGNDCNETEIDLGSVTTSIDPKAKTVMLNNTTNYTQQTRKGQPVKYVDKKDDVFIRDHLKEWDVRGDVNNINISAAIPSDPWHHDAEHILPTFQAEFCKIPFNTRLKDSKVSIETSTDVSKQQKTPPPDEAPPPSTASDKKCRTKSLSDVISRIKKDPVETCHVLTLDNRKTEDKVVVSEKVNCDEQTSIDLNNVGGSVNGECDSSSGSGDSKDSSAPASFKTSGLRVHDSARTLKRRRLSDYEDEAYTRDEASLYLLTESQDNIGKRCVCISNILRSLTFVPGNEGEFSRSCSFLALVGKLLLLHHEHPVRTQKTRNYDREEDADFADSCSSLQGESEWWWDFLNNIRENIFVSIANIAGQIDVSQYSEAIARPLLDGLLHWAICPSAAGQDPFASAGPSSLLSPQRLSLEALCKLCVTNNNVDLVIATPPFSRLERLCSVLTKHLCRSEDQVLREFSINLLHYVAAADSSMARVVASQTPCVSLLVAFIEQAEQSALGVANQHGISALRDNPDSMGTSLDMLRRAAATLVFLARHPDNKPLMVQQESRLLALVMSQILDQQVALLLSKVLYQISNS